ncbi:MAG TPA: MBL fold metallo-hydrolase [Fibrobacteraceae bacterium]|nr:MBL fold metallo-hydrolase [Fibrobacteraceae bacterium]
MSPPVVEVEGGVGMEPNKILMTVVVDDQSRCAEAPAEHGLSLHFRSQGRALLFDTGKSDLVLSNLAALGLTKESPEWIVLSHGHYDHTNGAPALMARYPQSRLHFHPKLTDPKWILDGPEQWRYGGVPSGFMDFSSRSQAGRCSMELLPGIFSSGSLAGDFAQTFEPGRFFRNETGHLRADAFPDEQALFVRTELGLSLISGCAHTGIPALIAKAQELFPREPFYALVGGFHLNGKTTDQMEPIVEKILQVGFQKVMPLHCTGPAFSELLAARYPELLVPGHVGVTLEL